MPETILHDILEAGVAEGASDWHLREDSPAGIRINRSLAEIDFVTDHDFMVQAANELISENQRATFDKTGDCDFAFEEDDIGRFRANLHRERGRIALTLRHVKEKVPELKDLGLPDMIHKLAESERGVIFVSGITGAGKSTTLARMVEHINSVQERHIITIEDPIEYAFADRTSVVEQREIGLDTVSFDSALVHVLRQDPDVIVIGEMRDRSTFETALMAAETGHLVLTTLHTTNAAQSVIRILDMYNEYEREAVRKSIAINLRAIICQRLVRRRDGKGVAPAVEIMINTPMISKLISENRMDKIPTAIDAGGEEGMVSFNRSLLKLIQKKVITEEEGLAASSNAEALQMNINGIFLNTDRGSIIGE